MTLSDAIRHNNPGQTNVRNIESHSSVTIVKNDHLYSQLMYCPGCGTENEFNHNYCRRCREDLRLVANAYKKTFPVKVAAAIDTMLDSPSERFRRNSVLMFLVSAGSIAALAWQIFSGGGIEAPLMMAFFGSLSAIWEYLAYKRCLQLGDDLEHSASTERFADSSLTSLQLSAGKDSERSAVYCPVCSTRSDGSDPFCRDCGANLQAVRMALYGQPKSSRLTRRLDSYVRQRSMDKKIGTAAAICLLTGLLYLLFASGLHSPVYIALSIMYLFIGVWDLLVYQRSSRKKEALQKLSSKDMTLVDPGFRNQLPSEGSNNTQPVNVTGQLTRELPSEVKRQ